MPRIHLAGKTLKGKNRVREQGKEYELIKTVDEVLFTEREGPWMLLQSVQMPDKLRWVHAQDDDHFRIIDC